MTTKKKDDPTPDPILDPGQTRDAAAGPIHGQDYGQTLGHDREQLAGVPDLEERVRVLEALVADKEEHIDSLVAQLAECQDNLHPRRPAAHVHEFWNGYEQALKEHAHRADGVDFVGRGGQTLSQALHDADVKRKAQVTEALADTKAVAREARAEARADAKEARAEARADEKDARAEAREDAADAKAGKK